MLDFVKSLRFSNTLLSILLLGLLLRLIGLNQSLWLDEAAQALESARPFEQQWNIPADFHPPLYHYWLHFVMYLGRGEWTMRLASVFPGVFTIWLVYLIGKTIKNESTGLWSALFLAIAPLHVYYSQELRMYSLSAMWSSLLVYSLLTKQWKIHLLAVIGGIFTLYLFPFMLAIEIVYLWITKQKLWKSVLLAWIFGGLIFIFWLPMFGEQLQGGLQLPKIWPEWKNLSSPGVYKSLALTVIKFMIGRISFTNNWLYGFVALLSLSIPIVSIGAIKKLNTSIKLILLWLLFPIFLSWFISFWIPIDGYWRLLFVLPAWSIWFAYAISEIKKTILKKFLKFGLIALSVICLLIYYFNDRFHRENWKTATQDIVAKTNNQPGSIVTFPFPEPFAPYIWYELLFLRHQRLYAFGLAPDLVVNKDSLQILNSVALNSQTIYHFEYLSDLTDPERKIDKWLQSNGWSVNQIHNYRGVGFIYEYVNKN